VLSALGLAAAERREDEVRTVLAPVGAPIDAPEGSLSYDLRYRGQAHELTVRGDGDLREAFEALHEERYGYRDPDAQVDVVTVRATRREPGPEVSLGGGGGPVDEGARRVFFGEEIDTRIVRGEPGEGVSLAGPAVVELPEATIAVPPGWTGTWDDDGTLRLVRA
jgi:N-methylhydantoinase A/oxoprolinase/acetone carboxylase beta subunit